MQKAIYTVVKKWKGESVRDESFGRTLLLEAIIGVCVSPIYSLALNKFKATNFKRPSQWAVAKWGHEEMERRNVTELTKKIDRKWRSPPERDRSPDVASANLDNMLFCFEYDKPVTIDATVESCEMY